MVVLDVRTEREYCQGHLCGAINIPAPLPPLSQRDINEMRKLLGQWANNWLKSNNRKEPVFVYCKKGIRADTATHLLRQMGITARNIGGVETTLRGRNRCFCHD